jgi:DNA-binding transcriptional regulator PaaX
MEERKVDITSGLVDGILKFVVAGGFLSVAMLAPNSAKIFDKQLDKFLNELDDRAKERELRRIAYYMKQKGLIKYQTRDYEHGIVLTKKGNERLKNQSYKKLTIPIPNKWDKKWRLIFFDIPIEDNLKRQQLTFKLRSLGFQQLQKSIWVHPFPCRKEIELITEKVGVRKYVTYIEISHIDSEAQLRKRFKKLLSQTKYN